MFSVLLYSLTPGAYTSIRCFKPYIALINDRCTLTQVFSALFFLMMVILGLGSLAGSNNVVITIISDRYPGVPKWRVTLGVCVVGFLVGLLYVTPQGQYILTLVDLYSSVST